MHSGPMRVGDDDCGDRDQDLQVAVFKVTTPNLGFKTVDFWKKIFFRKKIIL